MGFKTEPGKCSFDMPGPGRVNGNINGGLIQNNATQRNATRAAT